MRRLLAVLAIMSAGAIPLSPAAAQTKVVITASSESLFHAPIYTAQELGYFKQQNLVVETILTPSGPQSIAAVLGGDAQMVMGAPANPINARKQGADLVLFVGAATQYGANVVVSKKWADAHKLTPASTYKERLATLKGISVAVSGPGGGNEQIVRYLAAEAGLDADRDMTLVSLGGTPNMVAAYSQGRVDALSAAPPNDRLAVHEFGGMMYFNLGAGEVPTLVGYLGSGVAARADWLQKNPAIATGFVKALQMSYDGMHDPARTEQIRDLVYKARYSAMDKALFAEIWKDLVAGAPKTPEVAKPMIDKLVNFTNRFSKDKIDPAVADGSFTNKYVEQALAEMKR